MGRKRPAQVVNVDADGLTPYERERQRTIASNKARMAELGVESAVRAVAPPPSKKTKVSKPRLRAPTTVVPHGSERRSARARRQVNYSEDGLAAAAAAFATVDLPASRIPAQAAQPAEYAPPEQPTVQILPSYAPSEGRRDAAGLLKFDDHPEFRPNLTPKQVIQAGSFGGIYFNPRGGRPGIFGSSVDVDHAEFPADWFEGLEPHQYRGRRYRIHLNKYGVNAGQNQAAWESSGWIKPQLDPRGWFQWYCRFYMGRRTDDDERQMGRWKGVAGPKGRWKRALVNKIIRANARWDDANISPVIRQTCLHWAYELTEREFEAIRRSL